MLNPWSHEVHRTYLWTQQAGKEKLIMTHVVRVWQAVLHSPWHRGRAMHSSLPLWRKQRHRSRASETRTNAACFKRNLIENTNNTCMNYGCISSPSVKQSIYHQRERGEADSWKNEMPGLHLKASECGILILHKSVPNRTTLFQHSHHSPDPPLIMCPPFIPQCFVKHSDSSSQTCQWLDDKWPNLLILWWYHVSFIVLWTIDPGPHARGLTPCEKSVAKP